MLKKIGAVGGAVALALCWPFATGQIGERIYLDTLGQYSNPYMAVTNESYQRGYLSSEVVSRVELKDELKFIFEDEGLPTTWYIKHHVRHGFVGVSSNSEVIIDEKLKPIVTKLWGADVAPVTFTSYTALTRASDFTFRINPVKAADINGTSVDFTALTMEGKVDADGAGEFHYQLPSATLTTVAREEMVLKGLNGGGKGYLDGQFWIGNQDFNLASVSFNDLSTSQGVDVQDITMGMNNVLIQTNPEDPAESVLNNSNYIQVGKLTALDGRDYSGINFQMAFSDLNYSAISHLGTLSETANQPLTAQQAKEASAALDQLVSKGLAFAITNFSVTTPEGEVTSNLSLAIAPGIERISENIAQIAEKMGGEINLSLPVELVESSPLLSERVAMLEQNSLVERDATHYRLNMKIEGDKVVLASGDQLPLAMLFMLFM
ncbi:DUF945 family protein [Photobacterium nomapromontoriensis]|uniref:DUF945 family protein n=1 Tax=Photobacterium nomapromontoriensis TaxID=2910237 RepID=UPI003D11CCF8